MSSLPPLALRKLVLSYAPDWLITLALAAIFFSLDNIHGFERQFSLQDTSIHYTFAVHERVPDFALYVIAVVAPVVLQTVINLFTIRSWWDLHNGKLNGRLFIPRSSLSGFLGLALGLSITGSITQITKLTVGRPRPDFLDRCQPIPGSVDPVFGLSTSSICTSPHDAHVFIDGFRSFPSGHSSISFAGLGFLAFYLAGKLHLFDHRGYAAKAWLSLVPFVGAALVAISRTMDNRHHWQDVLVGSVLGTVVSYFSYRQYYPSLSSEVSHRPYSPRIATFDTLPSHHTQAHLAERDHPRVEDVVRSGPLEGTVLRQGPGSLRDVWRDEEETSALHPQPRSTGIPLETV
ncbi:phosphatidic acid phosphatase type 2/haloperoxidase [Roridomyces roridus]|uniref:Phosphatidic acid phosphatase type 2/haloperoxidase n=1 Tax=Roridomyces roridus TaxID=1738132 RepID=A0AAD7BWK6_9AGAR|nr:phosphatidic acid phosphatase type 2/haloperoxidase [Roridomyces roridus]